MGSLEPFVADLCPDLPEGVCCLVTRPALGIGSQWALRLPRNHFAPMLATTVKRERTKGNCWHDRMVWAAFLPQVPGLARERPPVSILDLGGYALW